MPLIPLLPVIPAKAGSASQPLWLRIQLLLFR